MTKCRIQRERPSCPLYIFLQINQLRWNHPKEVPDICFIPRKPVTNYSLWLFWQTNESWFALWIIVTMNVHKVLWLLTYLHSDRQPWKVRHCFKIGFFDLAKCSSLMNHLALPHDAKLSVAKTSVKMYDLE